jgi:hypothetical protein
MKTRITVGAALLLTLGSAVAGTFIYGQGKGDITASQDAAVAISGDTAVTPEMIAMWKVAASSDNFVAPKVPI